MRILVIEDHSGLAKNLFDYFGGHGHTLDWAPDGINGLHLAVTQKYDVIVLDLSLPGIDGIEVCRKLRQEAGLAIPIIMLTARDTVDDRVKGLDIGADDYLIKPFDLKELDSRIHALTRRAQNQWTSKNLTVGDLNFNTLTMEVKRAGQLLKLPPIPLKLLKFLMVNTDRVVSTDELEQAVWGEDIPQTSALRTHLHTLRMVIDKPFDRPLLKTIPGFGYRLTDGL
jgi:DNA-binding response OmpR family regulator